MVQQRQKLVNKIAEVCQDMMIGFPHTDNWTTANSMMN